MHRFGDKMFNIFWISAAKRCAVLASYMYRSFAYALIMTFKEEIIKNNLKDMLE